MYLPTQCGGGYQEFCLNVVKKIHCISELTVKMLNTINLISDYTFTYFIPSDILVYMYV